METQGLLDAATAVVDPALPISLTSHAVIEKHYESTYRILEKALEDQYKIRRKNLDDVVAGLEALISSQSEELLNYKRQIWDKDDRIRDLLYEIGKLRKCMSKVTEITKATGNEGSERETNYDPHPNSDSGDNINTLTKLGISPETKNDLRLSLPRRPKADASGTIYGVDDLIDGFGSKPGTSYTLTGLTDVEKRISSPSSVGASSQGRRPGTMSPRLGPIDEYGDISISSQGDLPFEFHDLRSTRMMYTKSPRPSSLGASLAGSENIHPLHRRRSLSRASSFDYPSGQDRAPPVSLTTPMSPTFARKEELINKLKSRKHAPEPQLTPESSEPDSVIRARIRMEVEKRKAASFGPSDRIKKTDIVHSVILSPARSPGSQLVPKTRVDVLAEGGFEKPELELGGVMGDGGKRTGVGLRQVVRKLRSDMWRRGSSSKQSESPVFVADE